MRTFRFSNAEQLSAAMRRRAAAVRREMDAAATEAAPVVSRKARQLMRDGIYDNEIPFKDSTHERVREKYRGTSRQTVNKKSIRLWRRTGNLGRREQYRTDGPIIVLFNDAANPGGEGYAFVRHEAGKSGRRQLRHSEPCHWQEDAARLTRPRVLAIRREHLLTALARR